MNTGRKTGAALRLAPCALALATVAAAMPALAAPTAQCRTRGQAALAALTEGKFAAATRDFAPQVASAVSPAMLQAAWSQLAAQLGTFKTLGPLEPQTFDGHELLVARLTFTGGALDALVACDADGRITTFRLVPASAVPASSGAAASGTAAAAAMAKLQSEARAAQLGPHPAVKAHALPDGARVEPLDVPSPFGPLRGALTLPPGNGPFPAVVLVAGSGPQDLDESIGPNQPFRDIAGGLARAGVASLRYDKRTFDYPERVRANPDFTIDDEITDDALSALRVLAKQQGIDPDRVFVLGHSEGAMLAPRIAQRDPHVAGAILLAAPARPLLAVSAQQNRDLGPLMGASHAQVEAAEHAIAAERALLDKAIPGHPPAGSYAGIPQSYWLSLHDYHQVAVAKSLAVPLLILQGGRDFQVSPEYDFDAWEKDLAGKSSVTFHLYPDLSHLFRPAGKTGTVADYLEPGRVEPRVIGDIADWIKAQPAAK